MSEVIRAPWGIFIFLMVSRPPQNTVQPVSATPSVLRLGDLFTTSCFGIEAPSLGKLSQANRMLTGTKSTLDLLGGLWIHFLDCLSNLRSAVETESSVYSSCRLGWGSITIIILTKLEYDHSQVLTSLLLCLLSVLLLVRNIIPDRG